ncbi:MAG: hypothetical protein ACRDZ2_13240, partial [Ilumatobacteraceae bacterium]
MGTVRLRAMLAAMVAATPRIGVPATSGVVVGAGWAGAFGSTFVAGFSGAGFAAAGFAGDGFATGVAWAGLAGAASATSSRGAGRPNCSS